MSPPARFLPTSLRFRLALSFLGLVTLVLFVGVASYRINRQVHTQVDELRSSDVIDLRRQDLSTVGLEFEGFWNPNGSFVANDVEVLPAAARPSLRGSVKTVDSASRTFTLYGRTIEVTDDSESADDKGEPVPFEELAPGKRVEVTCKIVGERWIADRVYLKKVKNSDKVKGTVTRAELDGRAPESVEIHGLMIVLEPQTSGGPESALGRIGKATRMISVLQLCLTAAHGLADGQAAPTDVDGEDYSAAQGLSPADQLARYSEQFIELVEQAQSEGKDPLWSAPHEYQSVLRQMARQVEPLRVHVVELRALADLDRGAASARVDTEFGPFVQSVLLLASSYLSKADEDLGDSLRSVLDRTASTTTVALATSVVAVIVALVLGVLVWRSIHQPMQKLRLAAEELGQGHLDTRIRLDPHAHDEFGVLADAFNKMAGELANTTVSMESLESVFDSMAAALIVFDPDGNIVNVNRATLTMVGRQRSELVGHTFDVMCRFSAGESIRPGPSVREPSGLPAMRIETVEKVFVRKDGSEFPVSLSGAELRSSGGPLQGYVCVALDLTEQKRIQEQLRESLGEKELLLREVHHRVKNNMQVISSLLAMQSTNGDPAVEKKLEESQNRIRSIALIHEQLYRSTELEHIDARTYLEVLTSQLLQSFGKAGSVRLELDADPLELDIDQSMACGLIVNELVTNALKYAYPADLGGVIRITLREHPSGERVLSVGDDGPGLGGTKSGAAKTLGMSLVATLARQLRGRVEVDGTRGTLVRVFFPRKGAEAAA
ncbi:MAG: PAS domain S-box protein [Planctomycetes bacterium]|nr:PAS domain S-box protein [Planctomycetota bacterium]